MRKIEPGLLIALDGIYTSLCKNHPDLPRALVTVEEPHPAVRRRVACWRPGPFITAAGTFEGRIAFGYPSAHRPEVPKALFTAPGERIMEIIVHEAAHALGTARSVKNTSRGGTWHNERYKELAEELGLIVSKTDKGGWNETWPGPALLARFKHQLTRLANARPTAD
jgi:hypothetical protein